MALSEYTLASIKDLIKPTLRAFKPPPDMTVSQWADEHRRLSAESSAQPGRFRTEVVEYMREPMDMVGKPGVRRITLMTSAQVAKSTVLENIIGYYMHQDPGPILHVSPTLESMKMFSKERLAPMIRDTPPLTGIVKDARSRDSGNTLANKALALDTPIPTPTGWTTMGDLSEGDAVFTVDGSPCKVLGVSPIFRNNKCYRVTFSDGDSVIADSGHLWEVSEWKVDKSGDKPRQVRVSSVKETTDIAVNFRKGGRFRYSLPINEPIRLPDADLPLDPYLMGFWLGDGYSHTGMICAGDEDADEIIRNIPLPVHERKSSRSVRVFRVGDPVPATRNPVTGRMMSPSEGVTHELSSMGLLSKKGGGGSNKHVPPAYLRASIDQRLALLQGLMDSDGHCVGTTCTFVTVLPRLAETFSELLASLGLRSQYSVQKTTLNGERKRDAYIFSFASPEFKVFRLKRKASVQERSKRPHGGRRITNVEVVESVPTRCILVDHPRHLFLAGRSMFPTHNTFPGGHIAMVGSNAPAGLASRPIRVLVCDEVDRFESSAGTEGDPINLAIKRTTTFWNRVLVFVSTPGDKSTSRIEKEFLDGDQRHRWCPCPHCGEYQKLQWAQVKWSDNNPNTAYYACEHNGCVIDDQDRNKMVREGEWRAENPEATKEGYYSYHLSQLYSPFAPLSDGVRDFLTAKNNPELLKTWVNTFLGETWEEKGSRLEWSDLMDQRELYDTRDLIPEDITLITAGVDINGDWIAIEYVGWGDDERSWSLGYHDLYGDLTAPYVWEELRMHLQQTFTHPLFGEMAVRSTAVDSGFFTSSVYDFTNSTPNTVPVKGIEGRNRPIFGKPSSNSLDKTRFVPLGVDTIKDVVFGRLKQNDPDKGGYCAFPMPAEDSPEGWYDEKYFQGLTAEEMRTTYIRGFPVKKWEKISKGRRNEPFDCRNYAFAALRMLQVDLNAQRRVLLRDVQERDKTVDKQDEPVPSRRRNPPRRKSTWGNSWKD